MADMDQQDADLRPEIYSAKDHLTGMIAVDQVCLSKPFTSFLFFDGEARHHYGIRFACGKRNAFVKIKLERDGAPMTVVPVEGNVEWLPKMTRVERDLKSDWSERNNFGDSCLPEHHAALDSGLGKTS